MSQEDATCCGDYCGKCPNYQSSCRGCIPIHHTECPFVRCCLDHWIPHCGLCDEFPCHELESFRPDDRPGCPPGYHLANLRRRMQVGTQQWLDEQSDRWERLSQSKP